MCQREKNDGGTAVNRKAVLLQLEHLHTEVGLERLALVILSLGKETRGQ